jgi:hypothetical protein
VLIVKPRQAVIYHHGPPAGNELAVIARARGQSHENGALHGGRLGPLYEAQGKSYLKIAMGCTGGRHRSVGLAECLAQWLRSEGRVVTLHHRDMDRERRRRIDHA